MDPNPSEGYGNRWSIDFFAGSCWQDQMYMELVFNSLSQAICLILPAVFVTITSSLLASAQLKPILRRAVRCLPEPLWALGDLPACAGDKNVLSLPPLSLLSLQYHHRQEQGLDFISVLLCQWNSCVCGLYARWLHSKGSKSLMCSNEETPVLWGGWTLRSQPRSSVRSQSEPADLSGS